MKYFLLLILSFNFIYSNSIDFETRQKILKNIKDVIQAEEAIARAYEKYLINTYNGPSSGLTSLKLNGFLGSSFPSNIDSTYFNDFVVGTPIGSFKLGTISYALKSELKGDSYIKELYESNTFRKRTYCKDDKIYFIIEDSFARHIYDLYGRLNLNATAINPISNCSFSSSGKYCFENKHIKIYTTDSRGEDNLLMYYHVDKFKTGPIIITSDTTLQTNNDEFNSIPRGAILYDKNGIKYIKTLNSIEKLR